MAYHAHLLANMHDAVFATDLQFKVTAWSKGVEMMYGWRADEKSDQLSRAGGSVHVRHRRILAVSLGPIC